MQKPGAGYVTRTPGPTHYECARGYKNINNIFMTRDELLLAFKLVITTRKKRYKRNDRSELANICELIEPELATQIFKNF